MSEGHGNSAGGTNPFAWSQYDALPAIVRRAIQDAPVCLGTARAWFWLQKGHAPLQVARAELKVAETARRRLLLTCWPPVHPELSR